MNSSPQPPSLQLIQVNPTEFERVLNQVIDLCDKEDRQVSEEIKIERFDRLYDDVTTSLEKLGSFSDGGLEDADFSSSRYVDPGRCLQVTTNVRLTQKMASSILVCLVRSQMSCYVHFDSADGQWLLCSDGRFFEQL